ncbi:hypothetical protein K523DRAFT_80878 [Schizophyllum commune Tattone D]|nr:hypothetical protein K523DRAFT_80878 [Schizophyllum commune Tattone D]
MDGLAAAVGKSRPTVVSPSRVTKYGWVAWLCIGPKICQRSNSRCYALITTTHGRPRLDLEKFKSKQSWTLPSSELELVNVHQGHSPSFLSLRSLYTIRRTDNLTSKPISTCFRLAPRA